MASPACGTFEVKQAPLPHHDSAAGAKLARVSIGCDQCLFSRTGHWVQRERAEEFNAVTTAFLLQDHPAAADAVRRAA